MENPSIANMDRWTVQNSINGLGWKIHPMQLDGISSNAIGWNIHPKMKIWSSDGCPSWTRLVIGILGVIGCFVVIIGTAALSIASAKSRNAYCFSG